MNGRKLSGYGRQASQSVHFKEMSCTIFPNLDKRFAKQCLEAEPSLAKDPRATGITYLAFRGTDQWCSDSHCSQSSHGGWVLATSPNPKKFWKCYVDDTCCALATSDIDRFYQHMNSISDHIQFRIEIKTNGQLPFLDFLLRWEEDRSISTLVSRMPTHTDRYLDYSSHFKSTSSSCTHSINQIIVYLCTDEDVQVKQPYSPTATPIGLSETCLPQQQEHLAPVHLQVCPHLAPSLATSEEAYTRPSLNRD